MCGLSGGPARPARGDTRCHARDGATKKLSTPWEKSTRAKRQNVTAARGQADQDRLVFDGKGSSRVRSFHRNDLQIAITTKHRDADIVSVSCQQEIDTRVRDRKIHDA